MNDITKKLISIFLPENNLASQMSYIEKLC